MCVRSVCVWSGGLWGTGSVWGQGVCWRRGGTHGSAAEGHGIGTAAEGHAQPRAQHTRRPAALRTWLGQLLMCAVSTATALPGWPVRWNRRASALGTSLCSGRAACTCGRQGWGAARGGGVTPAAAAAARPSPLANPRALHLCLCPFPSQIPAPHPTCSSPSIAFLFSSMSAYSMARSYLQRTVW